MCPEKLLHIITRVRALVCTDRKVNTNNQQIANSTLQFKAFYYSNRLKMTQNDQVHLCHFVSFSKIREDQINGLILSDVVHVEDDVVVAGIKTALAGIALHVVVTGLIHTVNDLLSLLTG